MTREIPIEPEALVRKSDGSVVAFDQRRIRRGIVKAVVRKYKPGMLNQLVDSVTEDALKASSAGPVSSKVIGDIVMQELRTLDPVSHVRFALVYIGRRDRSGRSHGWANASDFRNWLYREYVGLEAGRIPAGLQQVVKRDGRREPFDVAKLERSIGVASKGRGRDDDEVRGFASTIAVEVMSSLRDQPLVTSGQLATEIMRSLRNHDDIAYLRYASTAKGFGSVEEFEAESLSLLFRGAETQTSMY